jgi:hypothetical protein
MKLAKLPKVGDIIKFKLKYMFTHGVSYPIQYLPGGYGTTTTATINGPATQTYVEIEAGTLVEVLERRFTGPSDGMSDNFELILIVSVIIEEKPMFFRVNYSLHKDLIEILESSKALKVLYETKE